jgi:hypothetical protein
MNAKIEVISNAVNSLIHQMLLDDSKKDLAHSLKNYEAIRENPPFYFNKEITKQKRSAVIDFIKTINQLKSDITNREKNFSDKIILINIFTGLFYRLRSFNEKLRPQGKLTGILEHYGNDIDFINDEMNRYIKSYRESLDQKIFLLRITLHMIKAESEGNSKSLELPSSKFYSINKELLERSLKEKDPEGFAKLLTAIEEKHDGHEKINFVNQEIENLEKEQKLYEKIQIHNWYNKQLEIKNSLTDDELNNISSVRFEIKKHKNELIFEEKYFLWKKADEAAEESSKYAGNIKYNAIDKQKIGDDFIPWLRTNFNDSSLTLEGSRIIKSFLNVENIYDIQEIFQELSDTNINIDKKDKELESQNVKQLINKKSTREVNTELAWIRELKVKIGQLMDFVKKFLPEEKGDGEGIHP